MQGAPKRPFPLPFKGKGDDCDWRMKTLRRRLEVTQAMCGEIERDMRQLIHHFEQTFRSTLPAYLALHNTGNGRYVRWRISDRRQRYFTLCHNETGEQFLQPLSPSVKRVIFDFEQQRLQLNLLHALYHFEAKTLGRFLSDRKALTALRRGA